MSDNISHWLETAYSRICAGEAEANVLRDYGLIREEAFTIGVEHLRQENERLREEVRMLRLYGNKDCTAMADEAMKEAALAAPEPEPESKTPAWWVGGLTVTLMREGVNKHRAREIAKGYWEAYCQISEQEDKT